MVSTRLPVNPRSTPRRFTIVFTNITAATSSTSESATWPVTSTRAAVRIRREPASRASPSFIAACGSVPSARTAGHSPVSSAGGQRDAGGERRQPPVVLHIEQDRSPADREESRERLDRHVRDQQTAGRAEHEQHQRLGQQLPEQTRRAGAGGQPDRELARARGAARQQQVAEVGARDQQDDAGDQRQRVERHGETRPQPIEPLRLRTSARGDRSACSLKLGLLRVPS